MTKANLELLEDWPRRHAESDDHLLDADAATAAVAAAAAEIATCRDALLEDWLKRKSCLNLALSDSGENEDASAAPVRNVRFADTSQLYLYEREPWALLRSLSYAEKDRKRFRQEAMVEGLRIRMAINQVPFQSVVESFGYLLHHDVMERDDIVGIEHFCLDNPRHVVLRRRRHVAAVLRKQQELKEQECDTNVDDVALMLGKFAQSSSFGSTQSARMRAEVAVSKDL